MLLLLPPPRHRSHRRPGASPLPAGAWPGRGGKVLRRQGARRRRRQKSGGHGANGRVLQIGDEVRSNYFSLHSRQMTKTTAATIVSTVTTAVTQQQHLLLQQPSKGAQSWNYPSLSPFAAFTLPQHKNVNLSPSSLKIFCEKTMSQGLSRKKIRYCTLSLERREKSRSRIVVSPPMSPSPFAREIASRPNGGNL